MALANGAPPPGRDLESWLRDATSSAALAETVLAISRAAAEISRMVRLGPLAGALGAEVGGANADGDSQRQLDVLANAAIVRALRGAPVACLASEEEEEALVLRPDGALAVAVDPLDGSSNIDTNTSIGTIFSIFPVAAGEASASFLRKGAEQVAAGYAIYGPHTALALTLGAGTFLFVLDADDVFRLAAMRPAIPRTTREYAINASNYRYWLEPVRDFVDDCIAGVDGPRGKDFNMRWLASLVGEMHRILMRGGVFLYPADKRPGYERGRLRMLYEAAPIAFLVEQAGGRATDGVMRILDKAPSTLHERTPLIFGSADKVDHVVALHTDSTYARAPSPLFGRRGLFRA